MKELNMAFKEFYVAVRSKRFIGILVFYLFFIFLMNYALKDEIIASAGQIRVFSVDTIFGGQGQIAQTPVSLSIFMNLETLTVFGALIGVALGADSINKEIEEGTIKVLLSHPIYRDQFINGKFLGNALALMLIIFIGYVFSIAYFLTIGVPIDGPSMVRALLAAVFTLIYMLTFLSLGIMLSSLLKKPETSMLIAIVLAIFLTLVYPMMAEAVAGKIAGEQPYCPPPRIETSSSGEPVPIYTDYTCPAFEEWQNKLNMWKKRLKSLSPASHYSQLVIASFAGDEFANDYFPIGESLSLAFNNLAILIVQLLLPFSIAYVKFMTSDLR
ncbi:ABC transporter permease [Thermococcus sp. M39]|uniref:ABC transporter permease n=1 Tax=unclassified Thermococcus TaxID=2627626 RepID=UPI00143B0C1B|nr:MULTISPECIES: ABC transporter permease [unclassified Thermococcus]NJE08791.1 ABC transporter permease [Thermococcus sp. M39]NJE12024.1 ABC transporter permease [Thermococcus sp. LS2]